MSSLATMSAVGMWTGITETFAHAPEQKEKYRSYNTGLASSMEYRKLGALDVSAIGLGCLPMVGYYGGKYDKHEMIALIRRAYDEGVTSLIQPKCTDHIPAKNGWVKLSHPFGIK